MYLIEGILLPQSVQVVFFASRQACQDIGLLALIIVAKRTSVFAHFPVTLSPCVRKTHAFRLT